MWADRRAPSAPTWLLILALHAGLLALLNTRTRLPDMPRTWSEMRLIPSRPTEVQPAPPLSPGSARGPAPVSVAPPAVEAPPQFDAPPAPTDASPAAIAEPPAPLRLTLPDAATLARQPALDDPRGNTPVSRIGARIAHDLGDGGRWEEERMEGADFVRLRRGNTCINLHRNSGAARDRFNESVSPALWGATPAYRCERR